jgi:hypothetical protein
MIKLYHGSGAQDIGLLGAAMPPEKWSQLRATVARLLRARKAILAAETLEKIPFEIRNGTNVFSDDFCVLYWSTSSIESYVEAAEWAEKKTYADAFTKIAETVSEIGHYIRFIAVDLNTEEQLAPVASPNLNITSDVVERALRDAEQLIRGGAVSGLDRVHTALVGYLQSACNRHSIAYPKDPGVTTLFKLLRTSHPAFNNVLDEDVDRIVKALSVIVDALNPLRNRGSMAHANEHLLDEPEAMLAINSARSILHYLDAKLGK